MPLENNSSFFTDLPLLQSFFKASDPDNYFPLPDDWYLAVTDIENSTEAIQNGKYKLVNILGASPIVGLLNPSNKDALPYTFGGDGCTICIPPHLIENARKVLASSRQIGQEEYNLNLRAAIIPVQHILEAGLEVNVAKYKVSEVYNQAVFSGGGLAYSEQLLKSPDSSQFLINSSMEEKPVDFTGLECRWQEVSQHNKQVMTMLVKTNPELKQKEKIYEQVLEELQNIFGFDGKTNPINSSQLSMNTSVSELMKETKFRTFGAGRFQRLLYLLKIEMEVILGKIFMALGYESSTTDWSLYKADLALNSDHRKFDDMLRLVISGTEKQIVQLKSFLQGEFKKGNLAYGVHLSETAIITCMVFRYQRNHIHFVDGSEGGYVKASEKLKIRMEKLSKKTIH